MYQVFISVGSYFVEWWIAFLYFNHLFEIKRSKLSTIIIGIMLYVIPAALYIILYNSFLNTALFFIANLFYSLICYKTSWLKSIITSAILTALMTGSEFIVLILLSVVTGGGIDQYLSSTPLYALAVTLAKTLYLVLSILIAKLAFSYKSPSHDHSPAFLFIFPLSTLFIDFLFWEIVTTTPPTPYIKIMINIGSVTLLISILLTYVFYGKAQNRSLQLFQLQNALEKAQIDKEYYTILDHQNEELRTFIHDEKSHLTALQTLPTLQEVHTYVDTIVGKLQYVSPLGNTKNKMLDLILSKYSSLCKIKNIVFSYSTFTANLSFMDDTDLVSLMSNIMDNAVEAAETAEKGRINLVLEKKAIGLTILTCENTSGRAPIIQNGKLKTSKENVNRHGIGIKSIVRTAKKYDGTFEWSWDDHANLFTVTIAFER